MGRKLAILVILSFALLSLSCDEATHWAIPHISYPQHPHMAPNGRNNMHDDAYMSDTYELPGPMGKNPYVKLQSYANGTNTCVTIAFDSQDRILTTSASMLSFRLLLLDPDSLQVLASYDLPDRDPTDPLFPYDDTSGATYFVLDDKDRIILADAENSIQLVKYFDESKQFKLVQRYDLSQYTVPMTAPARDHIQMAIPSWDGRYLWFTSRYGMVGTIDTDSGKVQTTELQGEELENSFAMAEDGTYIVSDHAMYRFSADNDGKPVQDWRTPYDRGTTVKPSNFNQGSGTTPQIFGDLVAIGDNAEPRMNILFLRRSDGSEVCRLAVFGEGKSTTENALPGLVRQGPHGLEYSVIVDNNYGIRRDEVLNPGGAWTDHAGHMVRVDALEQKDGTWKCTQVWESQEKSSQVLPKLSLSNGLLYIYTYKLQDDGQYQWFLTGLDFETGKTAFSIPTGSGIDYANFGQPLALGPDSTAYLGTMGGLVRITDTGDD